MNDVLNLLYGLKNGGDLSADECGEINKVLAVTEIEEIPKEQLENVKDYLLTALNMNSVDKDLVKGLEALLKQSQENLPIT